MRQPQTVIQRAYNKRQMENGMSHMRVWVPTEYREQVLAFVKELRNIKKTVEEMDNG